MSAWNFSFGICFEPTTATSSVPKVALEVPPQPAARSASKANAKRPSRFMEKAPFAADFSRCLARGQYSIDQSKRLREAFLTQTHLAVGRRVDGGIDAQSQVAQLRRAEHHLPHARLAATEDEVVGARAGELELCLLDQEQILDGLGKRTEAVLRGGLKLPQLVLVVGEGEPTVQVDLQRLGGDVVGGHVRIHACVDPDRTHRDAPLAGQLRDRFRQELDIQLEAECGDVTGLLVAEQVARAANLEVAHRDRETGTQLGVVGERRQAGPRFGGQLGHVRIEQVRVRGHVGSPDTSADLVQLRQAELIRALDDQRVRLGDVESGLDDRRRDERIRVAAEEGVHLLLQLALSHLPVRDEEAQVRTELPQLLRRLVDGLDAVVEVEALAVAFDLALERQLDELLVELADGRANRAPSLRRRLDDGDVAQPGQRHVQGARDRGRAQRQHVDLEAQRAQQLFLGDAEALLLVEDDEPEFLRDDVAAEDAVRADQDVHLARLEIGEHLLDLPRRAEARDHLDANGKVPVARAEGVPMLLGQDRRGREHQRLLAVDGDGERGADRDLGLAEADVTAHEPVHRPRRLEVLLHRLDRGLLVRCLAVGKRRLEAFEPLVPEVERDARRLLALCVEREQLAGELADGLARAVLEVLPGLAAELRQRGRRAVDADVPGDLPDLLVRDVEPVVPAEGEEQVIARDAGDLLRLEAEKLAHAVVLVDDVVPGAQVGERLERTAADATLTRGPLAEDLCVREEDEAEIAPDEATAGWADGEQQLGCTGKLVTRFDDAGIDPAQQILLTKRLAQMRERDNDALTCPDERRQFVLRLRQSARDERRSLHFEGKGLPGRERIEQGGALEGDGAEAFVFPDGSDLVRLPHEVRPNYGQDEVGRNRDGVVIRQRCFDQIEPAFSGGIDDGGLDRMERALCERRERPHLLDLVAPELHAQRLATGRREDVDESTAHGELPPLVRSLDPLVAGQGEGLGELLQADLLAAGDPDRLRAGGRRRHRLGERGGRRADETSRGEHVECARALADEVRRRIEAGSPVDAAAR